MRDQSLNPTLDQSYISLLDLDTKISRLRLEKQKSWFGHIYGKSVQKKNYEALKDYKHKRNATFFCVFKMIHQVFVYFYFGCIPAGNHQTYDVSAQDIWLAY